MSPITSTKARHSIEWSPWRRLEDEDAPAPATGKHQANLIDAFRKHLKRRFGSR